MFKQTIKINILSTFLLLIGLVSLSLLTSQYYFNNKLAINSTEKTFKLISSNVNDHLHKTGQNIRNILNANVDNIDLTQEITFNPNSEAFSNFTQILKMNTNISAVYFTHKDGSFYEVININISPNISKIYSAPKNTRWIVVIQTGSKAMYAFLDKKNILISKKRINLSYNSLTRPWYKNAMQVESIVATQPYFFNDTQEEGITYSTQTIKDGTVFAIDYTLKNFNKLLAVQKFEDDSEIFLFTQDGTKFASSNAQKAQIKTIDQALMKEFINKKEKTIIKYSQDSQNYFTMYKPIGYRGFQLGIKLNTYKLYKPYKENMQYSLLISLLLLLISLPLIFFAISHIVKPIKALILENEKIKNREFSKVTNIDTHIIEFIELSDSFVVMSKSIEAYQLAQAKLLDSIVQLIAEAVDAKSAYTGGHCERVPEIAQMLVTEASKSQDEIFKGFSLTSKDELKEFEIGAWLHDCGKVTTPEYVVDKSTKLETIYDRIHEIRTRFEVLWRDTQITYLESKLQGDEEKALEILNAAQSKLLDDFSFIANANIGGEFMSEDKQNRVREIANQEWIRHFDDSLGLGEIEILRYDRDNAQELPATEKLLSDKKQHIIKRENFDYEAYEREGFKEEVPEHLYNYGEVYNLCIAKGTLSPEERYKINEHVILTIKMLEKIPFPSHMTKIPEYAGTHHETLIGTGYPRQLTKDELSIPARIMAIADVFEALTASDRPYKKAKTLSSSIKILSFMVKDEHLDKDIFKLFLRSGLYMTYAKKYLKEEQIDEVDIEQYL